MDLPYHPDDCPSALALLREGADGVVVERRNRSAYGLVRKVISWGNVLLLKVLFGSPFWDHNFVQFFRRDVVAALPVHSAGVSTVTAELILRARRAGHKVVRLTADYHPRLVGNSTITSRKVFHTACELFRLWFLMRGPAAAPRS